MGAGVDRVLCWILGSPRIRKLFFLPFALAALMAISWSTESWDAAYTRNTEPPMTQAAIRKLKAENERVKSSLEAAAPKGVYIVIDTAKNRLYIKNGSNTLLDAVCSTGNGKVLNDSEKNRMWVFDTPHGERRIIKKVKSPVWTKPDWAFIEEGEKIPTSYTERVEEDMLGDYAMHIGDGYMIHGTLYTRLIGRSVTHGCIRMGDADLEKVFKASAVGTPVFIY